MSGVNMTIIIQLTTVQYMTVNNQPKRNRYLEILKLDRDLVGETVEMHLNSTFKYDE
jgi:hypothetical protein